MIRTFAFSAALALACAPAHAQLADARLDRSGETSRLWLAFEDQPERVRQLRPGILSVEGVTSPARAIDIAVTSALEAILLAPAGEDAVQITLTGAVEIESAELREGGVLVRLRMTETPAPAAETAAAPREERRPAASPLPPAPQAPAPPAEPVDVAAQDAAEAPGETAGPCAPTEAAVADSPWDLDALTAHADCLAGVGRRGEAIALYERVLAFEPGHYEAAMGLGRLHRQSGESEAAQALFEAAARNARTDGEALQARAAARAGDEG